MHSPIIYLINDDENYKGQLPNIDVLRFKYSLFHVFDSNCILNLLKKKRDSITL